MPIAKQSASQPSGIPLLPKEPIRKEVKFSGSKVLLLKAWGIYRKHTWKFVGMYLLMIVPALIGGTLIAVLTGAASLSGNPEFAPVALLLFIPFVLTIIVGAYSMIFLIKGLDQNISIWQAYVHAWKYFWRYAIIFLMTFLFVGLGFIALVIPGIILLIWYSQVFFVAAFEDLGGGQALARSKQLVKGYSWTILERYVYWLFIILAFNLLLVLPLIFLSLAGLPAAILGVAQGIISLIGLAANFVIIPVGTLYTYLMYKDLRRIKDKAPDAYDNMETGRKFGIVLLIIIYAILSSSLDYGSEDSDSDFDNSQDYDFNFDY